MAVNTSKVTSAANNGNVEISPHGTGKVRLTQQAGFQCDILSADTNGDVKRLRVNDLPGAPFPDFPAGTDLVICDRITDNQVRQVTVDKLAASIGNILGTGGVTVGPTPPSPAVQGDMWFNTSVEDSRLYIYYGPDTGGTSQWVDTSPSAPLDGTSVTPLNFPAGAAGATYDAPNGVSYTWNDTYKTWQGEGGGGATVFVGPTAPSPADNGDLWWDSEKGQLYIYYNDGGSSQWVEASPCCASGGGAFIVSASTPTVENVEEDAIWFNTADSRIYVLRNNTGTPYWEKFGLLSSLFSADPRITYVEATVGQPLEIDGTLVDVPAGAPYVLDYAWYKDNLVIPNQTYATIGTHSVDASHLGVYTCRISWNSDEGKREIVKTFVVTEAVTPYDSSTAIGGSGPVVAINFEKNGTGYTDVGPITYDVGLADGPNGSSQLMTVEVTSDGDSITSASIVNTGVGYIDEQILYVDAGNNDAELVVQLTRATTVTAAGTGYVEGNHTVEQVDGTASTVIVTIEVDGNGAITSLVASGGDQDIVDGTEFKILYGNEDATFTIDSTTTSVRMATGGSGYGSSSPITVNATGGSGQNCTVQITLVDGVVVDAALVAAGTGYFHNETLDLEGGDATNLATVTIDV